MNNSYRNYAVYEIWLNGTKIIETTSRLEVSSAKNLTKADGYNIRVIKTNRYNERTYRKTYDHSTGEPL